MTRMFNESALRFSQAADWSSNCGARNQLLSAGVTESAIPYLAVTQSGSSAFGGGETTRGVPWLSIVSRKQRASKVTGLGS